MTAKAEAGNVTGASRSPPNPQDGIMGGLSQQHSNGWDLAVTQARFVTSLESVLD